MLCIPRTGNADIDDVLSKIKDPYLCKELDFADKKINFDIFEALTSRLSYFPHLQTLILKSKFRYFINQ